ncbi:transposase [Lachnospiraceae bacterium TWA4]|nr:transposase [Lachnospiraceae bacterium TWA4]
MVIKSQAVRLYPNVRMKNVLDALCDYRRYCWNLGLETWNAMYDAYTIYKDENPKPTEREVRDELVRLKADWQYQLSSRVLQLAISDLGVAWSNFLNKALPDWGKPKFKSKRAARQGFKTDRAKLVDGQLRLDRPREIPKEGWSDIRVKGLRWMNGEVNLASIYRENGRYYANLSMECEEDDPLESTGKDTAVDVNVGHINYTEGMINTCPKKLTNLYQRIKHQQRLLARKREVNGKLATKSHNYVKTRAKLQRDYKKVANIQKNLMHQFTKQLVTEYDRLVIEDLDVKRMKMSHIASKGLHRSMFGLFRRQLTYKSLWYGKQVILADRLYPSTQRCSNCGHIKTGEDKITLSGNKKYGTKHNEYICYECGYTNDRDANAVLNLLALL